MYIAILGRQPALGIAELERLYTDVRWFSKESAIFTTDSFSIERVGGSQKAGRIITTVPHADWKKVSFKLVSLYSKKWSETDAKITLGISAYGFGVPARDVQKTGLVLKSKLKNSGVSLRLVPNQESFLNSASSHHNKLGLSESKVELLVIKGSDGSAVIAESIGAQNITALAARDQGRPKRDAFVGMLPPKLAQIMINLASGSPAHADPEILLTSKQIDQRLENENDSSLSSAKLAALRQSSKSKEKSSPFSGQVNSASLASSIPGSASARVTTSDGSRSQRSTISTKATLQPEFVEAPGPSPEPGAKQWLEYWWLKSGQKKPRLLDPFCGTGVLLQEAALLGYDVYGSDLSEKMVRYSRDNLDWLANNYPIRSNVTLHEGDATKANWQSPIDLVATETYLGQPFSAPPSPEKLTEVRGNCNHIITAFLKNIGSQLKTGTPLCLAIPAWRDADGKLTHLPLITSIEKLGYKQIPLQAIDPQQLVYFREDQIVARELLLLEKV